MRETRASLHRNVVAGLLVMATLGLAMFGWAARAELSGAVVANGVVAVKENAKLIKHIEGGIIRSINVAEGDHVEAGFVLVQLDRKKSLARLGIIDSQLIELAAEQARLQSERGNRAKLASIDLPNHFAEPDAVRKAISSQQSLLHSLRAAMANKKSLLKVEAQQALLAVSGLEIKLSSNTKQTVLAKKEYAILKALKAKKLTGRDRVIALERELLRLEGQTGQLEADIARYKSKVGEIELKILAIDQQTRIKNFARVVEIRTKTANLQEQRSYELTRLQGSQVIAPTTGYIHKLAVNTKNGIVQPGEVLMTIVPSKDKLVIRARVRPQDIDDLHVSQPARLRFTAFNRQKTPEIDGIVEIIGADQSLDANSNIPYYLVDISLPKDIAEKLGNQDLKPGMPVQVFITTHQQTVMAYLVKPFADQFAKSFKE